MAEERLIDDDKDKKYKIRKNADGEDELYIDMEEGEEEEESLEFEVPEFETDDEEAAVLTPEQYAERERLKKEEEEKRRTRVDELIARARQLIDEQSYEGALYDITEAEELINDGQVAIVKLLAATENLRSFSGEEVLSAIESVESNATPEHKAELSERLDGLTEQADALAKEVENLQRVNDEGKAERRGVFLKKRKNSLIFFTATAVPLIVFIILGSYFASIMHAVNNNRNIILTFVFFGIAGALFVVLLFAAHMLWDSAKKVSLNEKNSSTKTGREYESKKKELTHINRIIAAIKVEEKVVEENDIS